MLIHAPPAHALLSSLHSLSSQHFLLPAHFLPPGSGGGGRPLRRGDLAIRMGGGPRTYPGGVSKWQWKRMQAKKAQQLLKARLARERQLYEMRKRAELRDAVAHLERPWDPDSAASEAAPNLLSVAADDQLKALADRFHRPGGVDLWNDRDGPRVFESAATGAASARFFPRNAVHSVQPYALRGEAGAPVPRATAADVLLALGDGGQGVRENAAEEEAYGAGDRAPAVEVMEKDGTWEPVNALDDSDDSNAGYWSSDDEVVMGNMSSGPEGQAMVRRYGRNGGVTRWEAVSSMATGRDGGVARSGDAFFSGSEGARDGHLEQRWQQRSRGGSTRKHASGRWTTASSEQGQTGAGSFSDSEVLHRGSEPKWGRNRDRNGTGRWNAPRKDWIDDDFNSDSDNARGGQLDSRWGAQNKLHGTKNFRGRSKQIYSGNTNDGKRRGRYMDVKANNGDVQASSSNGNGRYRFGGGCAEDLEVPTWKPRRMNRARSSNGGRDDNMGGGSRRGENGAPRQVQDSFRKDNREDRRGMGRNGR